eukprot:jgi/Tetstr1/431075/TSEL_020792.t1
MSASEISAEQSKHAERDAQSKLYQYRYNAMKCKHGADEKHDNERLQGAGVDEGMTAVAGVAAKKSTSDGVGHISSELMALCEATFR